MPKHAGLMVPLFSTWSTSSWGIGEFPDLVALAGWSASAGFDRVMVLPFSTLSGGVTSPFSAMTAMGIDPNYIALDRVEDFARAGGTAALSEDARLRSRSRQGRVDSAVRRRAPRETPGARAGFQTLLRRGMDRADAACVVARGLHRAGAVVARRLRALRQPVALDGGVRLAPLAGAAPRARAGRPRCGATAPHAGDPATAILAMACGVAVAGGAQGRARPRRDGVRRPAVHGERERPGSVDASERIPVRRLSRRPARRLQRDRTGLERADVPLGGDCRDRLRVDQGAGASHGRAVRRLSRRSPGWPVSDVRTAARRPSAVLQSRHGTRADPPGRAHSADPPRLRRRHRRRGSRRRAGLRARVARAAGRARDRKCCAGSAAGPSRASRSSIHEATRRCPRR